MSKFERMAGSLERVDGKGTSGVGVMDAYCRGLISMSERDELLSQLNLPKPDIHDVMEGYRLGPVTFRAVADTKTLAQRIRIMSDEQFMELQKKDWQNVKSNLSTILICLTLPIALLWGQTFFWCIWGLYVTLLLYIHRARQEGKTK